MRSPVAPLATSAQRGPSASTAHNEIAQYGIPREQFVEPSTGSTTTVVAASGGPLAPDSSLTTATPARASTATIAASATTSSAY